MDDHRPDDDFDRWFVECYPQARTVARRILGSATAAEDAAAEAFTRALVDWPKVGALPHRDAWVLRVTANVAIDLARKRRPDPVDAVAAGGFDDDAVLRVSLVAALALVGGSVALGAQRGGDDGRAVHGSASSTTVGPGAGETLPMATSPLAARRRALTAWTGTEMIVWGGLPGRPLCDQDLDPGCPAEAETLIDGAIYDPATDAWRSMAASPLEGVDELPSGNVPVAGFWTGSRFLVWSGGSGQVATYDPVADRWDQLPAGPLPPLIDGTVAWTGTELIVVGGTTAVEGDPASGGVRRYLDHGAALDPATGTWRDLPASPSGTLVAKAAAWNGAEVVVSADRKDGSELATAYDPATDSWRDLPAPSGGYVQDLVAVGSRVVAIMQPPLDDEPYRATTLDPATGEWSPAVAIGSRWSQGVYVEAGSEVLMPVAAEDGLEVVGIDPATGSVRTLTVDAEGRHLASGVWTGSELLLWGGEATIETPLPAVSPVLDDGVRYQPE